MKFKHRHSELDFQFTIKAIADITSVELGKLTPSEIAILDRKNIAKKNQWVAGRLASKQALNDYLVAQGHNPIPPQEISVLYNPNGSPILCDLKGKKLDFLISISHSNEYAVASIAEAKDLSGLGIDIEKIRSFRTETTTAFMTERELEIYERAPADQKNYFATLIWTGKESVLKALGTGLKIHPGRIELGQSSPNFETSKVHLDGTALELYLNWTIHNHFYIIANTKYYGAC
jgi:phosphopantetheine--protein transferase-like protein